jgi:signal transduction histidine kinase/ligand-binding sensor domain-containing protein/DNA-binding response OmpR family regulator
VLRFERLTLEDGLSQGHIGDILQDRRGFLWFATADGGLNRYDGYALRIYAPVPFDTTSLADANLNGLYEDRTGAIWITTRYAGLARFDPLTETFVYFQHDPAAPHSLSTRAANAVVVDPAGTVWVGTDGGLDRMDTDRPGHFTHYRHDPEDPTSLSHDRVRFVSADGDGMLWIGTDNGLNRMDPDRPGRFARSLHGPGEEVGPRARRINHLYTPPGEPGVRWLGTDDGLVRLDVASGTTERFFPGPHLQPGANVVTAVAPDPGDARVLWLSLLDEGLARFDTEARSFTRYRSDHENPHGLVAHAGTYVFTDRSGIVWVGSAGSGLNKFDPTAVEIAHYGAETADTPGLRNPLVWGLTATSDGAVWAGTSGNYLHRIEPATGTVRVWYTDPAAPASPARPLGEANAFAENPDGTLWIGTTGGLSRYDPATDAFTHYRHDPSDPTSLSSSQILALHLDAAGVLWVGTAHGLNRFDEATGTFARYVHDSGDGTSLGDDRILAFFEDAAGTLWVATRVSVSGLDRATGRFVNYGHDPRDPSTLTNGSYGWLHERRREPGVLWIGSLDGGGLDRLDTRTGTVTHYTTQTSELPDNTIYAILEDDDGRLWMSTNHGLVRFDPDHPSPDRAFRRFGLESGLQGLEFNQHAAARDAEGRLYFGGIHGINAFHPENFASSPVPPLVALTGLRIGNERVHPGPASVLPRPLAETDAVTLAYDQRNVTFEFAALHFKNPKRNRYRYQLLGFDDGWVEAGTRRTATYTNLPPGDYTFRVTASNSDGVWNEEGVALALTVVPPPWRTWWATLGYVVLLFGGLALVYRNRRNRLRLQHRMEMDRLEAEKLRELDHARSRVFANVSHEFRTPLTLTLGPLDDLQSGIYGPLPVPMAGQVDLARRNAGRVLDLINQILDVARLESGRTPLRARPLDLDAFVEAVAQPFRAPAARKAMTFEIDLPAAPVEVFADPPQLEKAVANLLSNALKFTPEGGTVRVSVAAGEGTARVAVRDSGPGIPAADLPYVFDRFYQVNEASQTQLGTGIGLALAKEVVDLHGGTLAVVSEEGFGSTFTVTLPLGRAHLAPEQIVDDEPWTPGAARPALSTEPGGDGLATEEAPDKEPPAGGDDVTTVLVVEDHPEVRAYVRRHLEPVYRVLEAADGEAGLALAKARLPDLVLSDVMMPKLDGLGLCRALRADPETDFIPVILLTAKAAPEDRLEGLGTLCDDYLTKPFDVAELRARIASLIAVRQRLRERFRQESTAGMGDRGGDVPIRLSAPADVTSADDAFLERVRTAVEAPLGDETFSVERLAEAVGVSRSHLHRQLKTLTGLAPSDLIRTARLERAAQLLAARAGTVSEVAYAVGFKSVSYFSDRFVRAFGCRPSDYATRDGATGDETA